MSGDPIETRKAKTKRVTSKTKQHQDDTYGDILWSLFEKVCTVYLQYVPSFKTTLVVDDFS